MLSMFLCFLIIISYDIILYYVVFYHIQLYHIILHSIMVLSYTVLWLGVHSASLLGARRLKD